MTAEEVADECEKAIVVKSHHPPLGSNQLTLNINDIITVVEKDATGWWGGFKEHDEDRQGWFPGSCVRLLAEEAPCQASLASLIGKNAEKVPAHEGAGALQTQHRSPTRGNNQVASPQRAAQEVSGSRLRDVTSTAAAREAASGPSAELERLRKENDELHKELRRWKRQSDLDRERLEREVAKERGSRQQLEEELLRARGQQNVRPPAQQLQQPQPQAQPRLDITPPRTGGHGYPSPARHEAVAVAERPGDTPMACTPSTITERCPVEEPSPGLVAGRISQFKALEGQNGRQAQQRSASCGASSVSRAARPLKTEELRRARTIEAQAVTIAVTAPSELRGDAAPEVRRTFTFAPAANMCPTDTAQTVIVASSLLSPESREPEVSMTSFGMMPMARTRPPAFAVRK